MKIRTAKITTVVTVVIAFYSPHFAAGAEPSAREFRPESGAPPAIEWNLPSIKDENTPKTLILCSEHVIEQMQQYRSLLERLTELKGYTIVGGSMRHRPTKRDDTGYVVIMNNSSESKALRDCVNIYPELAPIVTDFVQKEIPNQQSILQELTRSGALPPGAYPSKCYSKFYFSTEGSSRWLAYVGIDYSSDKSCFEDFIPNTFGISPRYCQSAEICSGGEMKGK